MYSRVTLFKNSVLHEEEEGARPHKPLPELNSIHGNERRVLSFCPKRLLIECCESHNAGREKKRRERKISFPLINSTEAGKDGCFSGWQSHSGLQATCRQRREGGSQSAATHFCNLRLKRSKRCRIKGLVCVCRHPCLTVQPGFQLISTLEAEVYLHVVWEGCRHRLKDPREKVQQQRGQRVELRATS